MNHRIDIPTYSRDQKPCEEIQLQSKRLRDSILFDLVQDMNYEDTLASNFA